MERQPVHFPRKYSCAYPSFSSNSKAMDEDVVFLTATSDDGTPPLLPYVSKPQRLLVILIPIDDTNL